MVIANPAGPMDVAFNFLTSASFSDEVARVIERKFVREAITGLKVQSMIPANPTGP